MLNHSVNDYHSCFPPDNQNWSGVNFWLISCVGFYDEGCFERNLTIFSEVHTYEILIIVILLDPYRITIL